MPVAAKKPYGYMPPEEEVEVVEPEEPAGKRKPGLAGLDTSTVDARILVLLASCVLAKLLGQSDFKYVPSMRITHTKVVLSHLPKLLAKVHALRSEVLHELAKAMRNGPRQYLKHAARELAVLLNEE